MAIPPLIADGVLPPGLHRANMRSLEERFVDGFAPSRRRREIFTGFSALRTDALAAGIFGIQWVDGSFVEQVENPNDIDVLTFVDFDYVNQLSGLAKTFILDVINGRERPKGKYRCHCFFVPWCRPGHSYYNEYVLQLKYWRQWFGTNRNGTAKGLVAIELGSKFDHPITGDDICGI